MFLFSANACWKAMCLPCGSTFKWYSKKENVCLWIQVERETQIWQHNANSSISNSIAFTVFFWTFWYIWYIVYTSDIHILFLDVQISCYLWGNLAKKTEVEFRENTEVSEMTPWGSAEWNPDSGDSTGPTSCSTNKLQRKKTMCRKSVV